MPVHRFDDLKHKMSPERRERIRKEAARQVARLERTGLVTATRTGNQKHYQARHDSPVFEELRGLIVKTVGVVEPLRRAER